MKISFKDILPNPYRDLSANPLNQEKVAEIENSINQTSFWDNVVVRPSPTQPGKYELAYGHHRFAAAKKAGLTEADFIVKDFDEAAMIKVMTNDNMEFRYSVLSLLEAVKAVVVALAAGKIAPFKIDPKVKKEYVRYAPRFTPGDLVNEDVARSAGQMAYTSLDVAQFLGYTKSNGKASDKIPAALKALYLIQEGVWEESSLRDFSTDKLIIASEADFQRYMVQRIRRAEETERKARENELKAFQAEENAKLEEARKAEEEAQRKADTAKQDEAKKAAQEKARQAQAARMKTAQEELLRRINLTEEIVKNKDYKKVPSENLVIAIGESRAVAKDKEATAEQIEKAIDNLRTKGSKHIDAYNAQVKKEHAKKAEAEQSQRVKERVATLASKLAELRDGSALYQTMVATSKLELSVEQRELLRQEALTTSEWLRQQSAMFLPPLSGKKERVKNVKVKR